MGRSIPVFRFAFAAYRAVAGRIDIDSAAGPARAPFAETWRSLGRPNGLLVKIEVCDRKRSASAAPESCRSSQAGRCKEIWLDDVKETARGFSGAVCMSQEPLRHVRPGQRIGFDPGDILDWTIRYDGSPQRPELCEPTGS